MKKQIPNLFTCLNLFCGCIATVIILKSYSSPDDYRIEWAAGLIFAAAFFDLLDGMAARMLNVGGAFGKQLDSLADMVSFGLVPGMVMFKLYWFGTNGFTTEYVILFRILHFFPFIVTIFSALRLAKFNIDTRQTNSFIGLPTPANTLLIISLPLILLNDEFELRNIILNLYFIIGLCMLQSYLLVAEIPLFSVKFKNFSWKDNNYQYVLILFAAVMLLLIKFAALPLIIFFYVFLSFLKNSFDKKVTQ